LQVNTEDVGRLVITANDFRVSVDGSPAEGFTISRASGTEFNIIVPAQISAEASVTVTGVNNLTGDITASQASQARITDAIVTGLRTINVTVVNPGGTMLSKDNFRLQIAGRANDSFTVTARSLTSYDINIASDIRSGQVLTIDGRGVLMGSRTVSALSAIRSVVFNDLDRFTVNTDNTAGNTIEADSFNIFVGGNAVTDFTVTQRSNTAYQISLPAPMSEGTIVRVEGKKFLTGRREDIYASPFRISRVTATSKTSITVALAAAPDSILTHEKHAAAFRVLVDDTHIEITDIRRDLADRNGRAYFLTVDLDGTQGILTVNGVRNSANRGAVDYVPPELVSVRMNDRALGSAAPSFRVEQAAARLIIEFSEPVFRRAPSTRFANRDVAMSGEAFNIISGTGTGLDLNGTRVTVSGNSVLIDLNRARSMEPGVYTLTVNPANVFDAIGNVCVTPENNIFRFEIKGTLPTVSSTAQTANGDIAIRIAGTSADNFGTAMTLGGTILISDPSQPLRDSLEISSRFLSYDIRAKTITISRAALPPALNDPNNPVFLSGGTPYRMEMYHPNFTRHVWRSEPAEENPLVVSRVQIDTERPKIETVTINGIVLYDRNTGPADTPPRVSRANAVIQVVFSKPVFEQPPSRRFTSIDTFGQAFNVDTANPLSPGNNLSLSGVRVATNNRTVSIPLRAAAVMNPGNYKIEIDPAMIFDSVGNSVDLSDFIDLPGFPRLVCYFDIVTMPPRVTAVSQAANGDITIRFTRYYTWLANPYGSDFAGGGTVRILDMSRPEGQRQIGNDITPEFFSAWNDVIQTLSIRRAGLPDNLTGGPYVLEIDVPDYEKQNTPGLRIVTSINNDPSVTLGGAKNIPVTPNAEQARITREDALIRINFPVPVRAADGAGFTAGHLGVTDNIGANAFTVYVEDGDGVGINLTRPDIIFNHSGSQVTIDLRNAVTEQMMFMRFTVAINQSMIFDGGGTQIGSRLSVHRFRLTQTPLPVSGAEQFGGGDIQIWFGEFANDPQFLRANLYINEICGVNEPVMTASTIRFERNGEIIGEIPPQHIKDGVDALIFSKEIIISRWALLRARAPDGTPIEFDGGEYTIVLTHTAYADNRIDGVLIDTKPPELTLFDAWISDGGVNLRFWFDKPVSTVRSYGAVVTRNNGGPVSEQLWIINNRVDIRFLSAPNTSPSDYTVKFEVMDRVGNMSAEIVSVPVIPEAHRTAARPLNVRNFIPGFANRVGATDSIFRFGEAADFSAHINSATRTVNPSTVPNSLSAIINDTTNPADFYYDEDLQAPVVTVKTDMEIHAPQNATGVRYVMSAAPSLQNPPAPEEFTQGEISSGMIILHNEIYFSATRNGAVIPPSDMSAADRANWRWTAERLAETSYYIIFEWSMPGGGRIYTYVQVIIEGS
jgi:hypothetical protein